MRLLIWIVVVVVFLLNLNYVDCEGRRNKLKEYDEGPSGLDPPPVRQFKVNRRQNNNADDNDDDDGDCVGKKCYRAKNRDGGKQKRVSPDVNKRRNRIPDDDDDIRYMRYTPESHIRFKAKVYDNRRRFNRRQKSESNDTDEDHSETDEDYDDTDENITDTDENITDTDENITDTDEDEEEEICVRNRKGKCSSEDDNSESEEREGYLPKKKKVIYIKKFAHEKESKKRKPDIERTILKIHKGDIDKSYRRKGFKDDSDDDSSEDMHPKRFQIHLEDDD